MCKRGIAYLCPSIVSIYMFFSMTACAPSATIQAAMKKGDSWSVGYWLDKDPRLVNAEDSNGESLLFSAIRGDDINMVRVLLAHGVDLTFTNTSGYTPLHLAIALRKDEAARLLIEKGADINAADTMGSRPIHRAASNDDIEMMKELIGKGADINARDTSGETPLHYALRVALIEKFKLETIEYMIDSGADVNARAKDGKTPLISALYGVIPISVLELLVKKGANVNAPGNGGKTPLHVTTESCRFDKTEMLIRLGADVNARDATGRTPLFHAVIGNKSYTGEDPEKKVVLLLDKGASVAIRDSIGITPLHLAAQGGSKEICRMLIGKGASVDAQASDGRTPLHYAAAENRSDAARLLLDAGAKADTVDKGGIDPLHSAMAGMKEEAACLIYPEWRKAKLEKGETVLNIPPIANPVDFIQTITQTDIFNQNLQIFSILLVVAFDVDGGTLDIAWSASNGKIVGTGKEAKWYREIKGEKMLGGKVTAVVTDGQGGRAVASWNIN
jgi:ankyrin repeat protein